MAKGSRRSIYSNQEVATGAKQAATVGELKALLAEYPDDLPVHSEGAQLVWFNVGFPTEYLSIEEYDGLWDEDDE